MDEKDYILTIKLNTQVQAKAEDFAGAINGLLGKEVTVTGKLGLRMVCEVECEDGSSAEEVGRCEDCNVLILLYYPVDAENYVAPKYKSDGEGVMLCEKCWPEREVLPEA